MDLSITFQILGSLSVLVGYYLNSKNNPRQHMAFILGHVFLLGFTSIESKWILFSLSVIIIYLQYKISTQKYKFKKDIVRVKRIVKPSSISIKITNYAKKYKSA